MITNRINIFVSLPLRSLDQLSLQRQLDAIGKTKDAGGKPASVYLQQRTYLMSVATAVECQTRTFPAV
jgi:hypothetical protein